MRPHACPVLGLALALLAGPLAAPVAGQQPVQTVVGVVRDTSGTLLAGADVILGDRRTRTDERGTFRVDSLRPGRYALTIRLMGFAPVRSHVPVVATASTELEYFLIPVPALLPTVAVESNRTGIYGIVGDTSYRAADGARVQVLGPQGGTVYTDSMGRFSFPAAERGVYMVRVTYPRHAPRQILVELGRDEGRELAVLLTPSLEAPTAREEAAMRDLGERLALGRQSERLTATELERYGAGGLCDIGEMREQIGTEATVIINGQIVLEEWPVSSLCMWRADELELVEFSRHICRDETRTIADRAGVWCGIGGRAIPRSIDPAATLGVAGSRSYIVIWERK